MIGAYTRTVLCGHIDGAAVTRVQIRAPDGARLTRRFLKSDPLSILWLYVKEQVSNAFAKGSNRSH